MRMQAFDFDLPPERIAARPAEPRDSARLLRVGTDGRLGHHGVRDLPALLRPGDLLVVNDTKVVPARLFGHRGAVAVEATLLASQRPGVWSALARPARRLRPGDRIIFAEGGAEGFAAEVVARRAGGEVVLDFGCDEAALAIKLERHGHAPLPPYIRRPSGPDPADRMRYQTVYARAPGAVAAPTAGLHFTPALLAALEAAGIARVAITLHVGAGTFLTVKTDDPRAHPMHAERGEISVAAAARINAARNAGGRIVAVGTTALRLMESARDAAGRIQPFHGETDIFILPGTPIRSADLLMTNFHLPRSTLFMLVSAFAGTARMHAAYAEAIRAGYRFYSYGDATLLERAA